MNIKLYPELTNLIEKQSNRAVNDDVEFKYILVLSDFLSEQQRKNPQWFLDNFDTLSLKLEISKSNTVQSLKQSLRLYRNYTLSKLIYKQFKSQNNTFEVMQQCSELADYCINQAVDWLAVDLRKQFGEPQNEAGEIQELVVIAMGKLGGRELNLSSDIDLIYTYPKSGHTVGAKRSVDNAVFFSKLVQQLISVLSEITQDGFVFRVDSRLRPFGESGPLVINFEAMESYYLEQGRDWERFAMIKARTITGNNLQQKNIIKILQPFTYRRYIDFSMLETPRKIKQQIEAELRRRKLGDNIKLGPGGIREIEFIVQAMQLIHGGKLRSLQQTSTLEGLKQIEEHNLLKKDEVTQLTQSYQNLRFLEHCLQGFADRQTQTLPSDNLNQQRLCYLTNVANWSEFLHLLETIRKPVHKVFSGQFSDSNRQQRLQNIDELQDLWLVAEHNDGNEKILNQLGYENAKPVIQQIIQLKNRVSQKNHATSNRSEVLIARIIPEIIRLCAEVNNQNQTVERMFNLIESVQTRSAYLDLFIENKDTLKLLATLFSMSPWIAQHSRQFPLVLDDLLNPNWLKGKEIDDNGNRLISQVARIADDDEEQLLDVFREFKQSSYFQLSACFTMRSINMKQLGNHLSNVAKALLEQAYSLAAKKVSNRYGELVHQNGDEAEFIVVAMGKLGSHEMGFSSDLDLVFIHDGCDSSSGIQSDNMDQTIKSITGFQYFSKLAQKLIHALSIRMNSGILYEIDTRLRPSGNSGFLVSSIEQYQQYQLEQAWTWEHQALTRARVICGGEKLSKQFKKVTAEVISIAREKQKLRNEIIEMRIKMKQTQSTRTNSQWDLKQGDGGLNDIDFLIQYLVLLNANQHHDLCSQTENTKLLMLLAENQILSEIESTRLTEIYLQYLDFHNRQTLLEESANPTELFQEQAQKVIGILANHQLWPWELPTD